MNLLYYHYYTGTKNKVIFIYSSDDELDQGAKSETIKKVPKKVPRTEGELGLDDLPPIPDLSKLDINIKEEDCIHMGNITSVVDKLGEYYNLINCKSRLIY